MELRGQAPDRASTSWDLLARELLRLRLHEGNPSYERIAQLVAARRVAQGAPPHAARIARSTVYDCFRTGRTRPNLLLVREIALTLGADDDQVAAWFARCRTAAPVTVPVAAPTPPPTAEAAPPAAQEARPPARASRWQVGWLLLACVALNLLGRELVDLARLPVHLDMVGTAVAAIALGPWRGALVGATTNVLGVAVSGLVSLPFALVNVAGALVWGYGVRRYGFGRTLPRFFALTLLVAAVCTVVAVPILALFLGGSTGHGQETIAGNLTRFTDAALVALGLSNLLVSVGDKLISGFAALVAVSALPARLRVDLPLTFVPARHSATPADRTTS